ncbi:MAG TPA: hypothetical protein DCR44_07645 [Acholeplasmatales bacterium]|nr:hypothetical protein [Acholeplasmatales bacterium]
MRRHLSVREISIAAMLLAILFVQEQLLAFDMNVQLTVLLIAVYAAVLPPALLFPVISGYVILDNLFMGSFNLLYTPAMFLAWISFALVMLFMKSAKLWKKVLVATIFGFVYGWFYAIPFAITFGFNQLWPYLVADFFPAEVTMAAVDLLTVLFLYEPLRKLLDTLYHGVREA